MARGRFRSMRATSSQGTYSGSSRPSTKISIPAFRSPTSPLRLAALVRDLRAIDVECFEHLGFFRAAWLTIRRLGRCQPFHPGGFDPAPIPGKSDV